MPTFDSAAALQAGVSQAQIDDYLAQHPELSSGSSSNSDTPAPVTAPVPTPASSPAPSTDNKTAAPVVGSLGDIGEVAGAGFGFAHANDAAGLAQKSSDLSTITQRLIEAASKQTDPARRAAMLQVAHDNLGTIAYLNGQATTVGNAGEASTPDVNMGPLGTVTPSTSMQQAAGKAIKTLSVAASSPLTMGATYGAGNTLEAEGTNTKPSDVALHAATNAAGFYILGKGAETVLTKVAQIAGPLLTKIAPEAGNTITKLGGYSGNTGAVDAGGNMIKTTSDYWDAVSNKLVTEAKQLTTTNPDAIIGGAQVGKSVPVYQMMSKLASTGVELPENFEFTPTDVQTVSSKLNQMAQRSPLDAGKIQALNDTFRSWAQQSFNTIKPGLGDSLEAAYTNAANGFQVYNKLDAAVQGKLSKGDTAALIKQITSMAADPNEKIILSNAVQDFANAGGMDFSKEVDAMQYKKLPIASSAWKLIKYLAGLGLFGEVVKHGF